MIAEAFNYIQSHWQLFMWSAGVTVGCLGTLIYVAKVKVPHMETRIEDLEGEVKDIKENGVVHKPELYRNDGSQIYVTTGACLDLHSACVKRQEENREAVLDGLSQVKKSVDDMETARQRNSLTFFSFMSAVKEKLDLKFTIPEEGGM